MLGWIIQQMYELKFVLFKVNVILTQFPRSCAVNAAHWMRACEFLMIFLFRKLCYHHTLLSPVIARDTLCWRTINTKNEWYCGHTLNDSGACISRRNEVPRIIRMSRGLWSSGAPKFAASSLHCALSYFFIVASKFNHAAGLHGKCDFLWGTVLSRHVILVVTGLT